MVMLVYQRVTYGKITIFDGKSAMVMILLWFLLEGVLKWRIPSRHQSFFLILKWLNDLDDLGVPPF